MGDLQPLIKLVNRMLAEHFDSVVFEKKERLRRLKLRAAVEIRLKERRLFNKLIFWKAEKDYSERKKVIEVLLSRLDASTNPEEISSISRAVVRILKCGHDGKENNSVLEKFWQNEDIFL